MKALSIWQPYALAIARGWKPIENRTWLPTSGLLRPGDDFAIHASKRKVDPDDALAVVDMANDANFDDGVWVDIDEVKKAIATLTPAHFGAVVAIARYEGPALSLTLQERAWFAGPHAWRLSNVRELHRPVPLRGMQGVFNVPPDVEAEVRRQLP